MNKVSKLYIKQQDSLKNKDINQLLINIKKYILVHLNSFKFNIV